MSGFRVKFNVAYIPVDTARGKISRDLRRWHNKIYDAAKPIYWIRFLEKTGNYEHCSTQRESGPLLYRLFC